MTENIKYQSVADLSSAASGFAINKPSTDSITPEQVIERYDRAKERRSQWETHWQDCYDYALPQRADLFSTYQPGAKRTDKIFDGTAPDSVDQLAASLLGELTPPWGQWFGIKLGPDTDQKSMKGAAEETERISSIMKGHFDRSNFAVEMHQCYLDLVVAGTACLLFEEATIGDSSAFRFTAVPISQVAMAEGADGRLDQTFRRSELTAAQIRKRFPRAKLPPEILDHVQKDPDLSIPVTEAVVPEDNGYTYLAVLEARNGYHPSHVVLKKGRFNASPFINFRWQKAPSEIYGRSPVMKVLPDIKTLNKVVELMLKNASIAVTGIWQADDDGVLNPATIDLTPGSIIPKAVGSAGLQPLDSPGRLDISEGMIEQLRASIRRALLTDKLSQPDQPSMTATEVVQRAAEMARLLGATFGRLQAELLTPLVSRAMHILARRGEITDIIIDGHIIDIEYRSPLARYQSGQEAQQIVQWLQSMMTLGAPAQQMIDIAETARHIAKSYGVPLSLIKSTDSGNGIADIIGQIQGLDLDLENMPELIQNLMQAGGAGSSATNGLVPEEIATAAGSGVEASSSASNPDITSLIKTLSSGGEAP